MKGINMRIIKHVVLMAMILPGVKLSQAFPYTLTAYLPGSPLHGDVVNAGGLAFWLGATGSAAYCPIEVSECPAGNETVLIGDLTPWVEVPGGQEGYVTPEGVVSYTQAHSIFMPINSTIGGWIAMNITSNCHSNQTLLDYKPLSTAPGGVFACPDVPSWMNATYQIYVGTPAFNLTNCIQLVGLLEHPRSNNDFGAWEYT